jgi:hypothetical protein
MTSRSLYGIQSIISPNGAKCSDRGYTTTVRTSGITGQHNDIPIVCRFKCRRIFLSQDTIDSEGSVRLSSSVILKGHCDRERGITTDSYERLCFFTMDGC